MTIINIFGEITEQTYFDLKKQVEECEDNAIKLNINTRGGDYNVGLSIYEFLRNSDKTIYTQIDGFCHSAGVLILLGAPLENRSASPLSTSLIHCVYTKMVGNFNGKDLENMATDLKEENSKLAKIYADRTNLSYEEALLVIDDEKERDAQWLLDKGFINNINLYRNMKENLFFKIKKLLNLSNKEIKDVDGNVLFTIDEEEIKVGVAATPDGVYDCPEVGKVTVEGGFITEIEVETPAEVEVEETPKEDEPKGEEVVEVETPKDDEVKDEEKDDEPKDEDVKEVEEEPKEDAKEDEQKTDEKDEKIVELTKKIEEMEAALLQKDDEIKDLKDALNDSLEGMRELKRNITSNYCPERRKTNFKDEKKISNIEEIRKNLQYMR